MNEFTVEYKQMWTKWNDFDGKSTVREYWMAWLVNFIIAAVFTGIAWGIGFELLSTVYGLAVIIPAIALFIRRMHDTGRSGWYWIWGFLPIIGWILVIMALIQPSK